MDRYGEGGHGRAGGHGDRQHGHHTTAQHSRRLPYWNHISRVSCLAQMCVEDMDTITPSNQEEIMASAQILESLQNGDINSAYNYLFTNTRYNLIIIFQSRKSKYPPPPIAFFINQISLEKKPDFLAGLESL